jgi:hypothetical protein
MTRGNKKSTFDPWTRLGRRAAVVVRFLLFRAEGRLTLAGLVMLVLLTAGPYLAWQRVGSRVAAGEDYQLTADRVELLPAAESVGWIRRDVKSEALRDAGLDRAASILDADLNERLAKAFRLHPWIASVRKVTKRFPARVEVEVDYRRPTAIVVIDSESWWPVDASGVVLPRDDFSPYEARRYPHITDIAGGPYGPTGAPWGDARVHGAAKIAAALAENWEKFGLARVAPLVVGTGFDGVEDYEFALYTQRGTRVYWGHGPDNSRSGEATTDEKAARLSAFVAKNGSLDGADGARDVDLRSAGPAATIPRAAAAPRGTSVLR